MKLPKTEANVVKVLIVRILIDANIFFLSDHFFQKNIMSVYDYLLRFRLYSNAPPDFRTRYSEVYEDLLSEDSQRFDSYIHSWISELEKDEIGTPVDRTYLKRVEGGIGGCNNLTCRQLRLFNQTEKLTSFRKFGEITLYARASGNEKDVWSIGELLEFGEKFKQVLESRLGGMCLDFYIAVMT